MSCFIACVYIYVITHTHTLKKKTGKKVEKSFASLSGGVIHLHACGMPQKEYIKVPTPTCRPTHARTHARTHTYSCTQTHEGVFSPRALLTSYSGRWFSVACRGHAGRWSGEHTKLLVFDLYTEEEIIRARWNNIIYMTHDDTHTVWLLLVGETEDGQWQGEEEWKCRTRVDLTSSSLSVCASWSTPQLRRDRPFCDWPASPPYLDELRLSVHLDDERQREHEARRHNNPRGISRRHKKFPRHITRIPSKSWYAFYHFREDALPTPTRAAAPHHRTTTSSSCTSNRERFTSFFNHISFHCISRRHLRTSTPSSSSSSTPITSSSSSSSPSSSSPSSRRHSLLSLSCWILSNSVLSLSLSLAGF